MDYSLLKNIVARFHYHGMKFLDYFIFYGGKIAGRIIFPILLFKNIKRYVNHPSYFSEYELKGKFRIFFEQLIYILRTGEINKNYFELGFDRVSMKSTKDYVPWLTFTHARNVKNQRPVKPEYDPYNYVCLLRDKFVFEAFCKGVGLNTPKNYGLINAGRLLLKEKKEFRNLDDILDLECDAFCKREVSFGGGHHKNIIKLHVIDRQIYINENKTDLGTFRQLLGSDRWIIQERITNQAPEYAIFHPASINTVRIVTINARSEIKLLCSFFRMGANGSHTDNVSAGGVGICVDNGVLDKWGFYKRGIGTRIDRHPNSGLLFEGYTLPGWHDIIRFVMKAHQLLYGLHSIGWDVAVTTNGIMLVEGNDNWDTVVAQYNKGARKEFIKYF